MEKVVAPAIAADNDDMIAFEEEKVTVSYRRRGVALSCALLG